MRLIADASRARLELAHREPGARPGGVAVLLEIQAVGVRRVEEQLLGRERKNDVRVAQVKGDVPLAAALFAQRLGDLPRSSSKVWPKSSRPQPQSMVTSARLPSSAGRASSLSVGACRGPRVCEPGLDARRVVRGRVRHVASSHRRSLAPPCARLVLPPQTPWIWSQSSSRATCQSFEPPSGVMCCSGSASSCST